MSWSEFYFGMIPNVQFFSFNRMALVLLAVHYTCEAVYHFTRLAHFAEKPSISVPMFKRMSINWNKSNHSVQLPLRVDPFGDDCDGICCILVRYARGRAEDDWFGGGKFQYGYDSVSILAAIQTYCEFQRGLLGVSVLLASLLHVGFHHVPSASNAWAIDVGGGQQEGLQHARTIEQGWAQGWEGGSWQSID